MIAVSLYHTSGCHLCELAHELLIPFTQANTITLELIDIADSNELIERYGVRIPVLKFKHSEAELSWPFTDDDVNKFISEAADES